MEPEKKHTIYGIGHHGRHENDVEAAGIEPWDPNLAGEVENSEALEDIIGDGIHDAIAGHSHIDETTARTIARTLAFALNGEAPHLEGFARGGTSAREALEAEYLDLHGNSAVPEVVRDWINWLASYLFWREYPDLPAPLALPASADSIPKILVPETVTIDDTELPLNRPASLKVVERERMIERLQELVNFYGDSLRAYLSLPDINASAENLLQVYTDNYVGVFEDVNDAMFGITELHEWTAELEEWANPRGLADMVSIDLQQMELRVRDVWDLVEVGGRIYVFNR